jgi:hypothetical protein
MNSTRALSQLPDIAGLRKLLQSLAMLDAILCREWEDRYYSFNAHWDADEQLGSMRDGSGDDFFALFNAAGCFLKGFAHEAPMSPYALDAPVVWPGVLEGVPKEFSGALMEPAFRMTDTTFCIWRRYGDAAWQHGPVEFPPGPDPDGSEALLSPLDGRPQSYQEWAEEYYEQPVPLEAVRLVYEHRPLTEEVVALLNPEVGLDDLAEDIKEIGYPA